MEGIKLIFLSIIAISFFAGCTKYIHPHVPLPAPVELTDFEYTIANKDQNITNILNMHTHDFVIIDLSPFYRYESESINLKLNDITGHAIADFLNDLADNKGK